MITIIPDRVFERFIECLACAGHANSELHVYSIPRGGKRKEDGRRKSERGWKQRDRRREAEYRIIFPRPIYARSLEEFSLCR